MSLLRKDFPQIQQSVRGKPLIYLDSAATTLKPSSVVGSVEKFLSTGAANVHRGAHFLSDQATEKFEQTRKLAAEFLNAKSTDEIVFTSGTTDGLNLLAQTLGDSKLSPGDVVLLTEMEHHSNIVPWQLLKKKLGIELKFVSVTNSGDLDLSDFESKLNDKVKILSIVHCSNTLGTLNPIEKMIKLARSRGVTTIVDAAQSVSCVPVDVQKLNCDFLVFSGHKLFGPYGVGILYGKTESLSLLPPYRGGGAMIEHVGFQESRFLPAPQRFEAGTPNIEGVIGLGAAFEYLKKISWGQIEDAENRILNSARKGLESISGIKLFGSPEKQKNILSFTAEWGHATDLGHLLDQQGIAVRSGHHCTQPLLNKFSMTATVRASFSIYSNDDDVQGLIAGLKKAKELLS